MADAAAKEPSMEEILSSIRRIIAEEDDTAKQAASSDKPELESDPEATTSSEATPIVGLDDTLRGSILQENASATPSVEPSEPETVAEPAEPATPKSVAPEPPAVPNKPSTPVPQSGSAMSLANIAAGLKRPGAATESETKPTVTSSQQVTSNTAKPVQESKPAPAPNSESAGKQVRPEPQVLKVRLSNPEKPPQQFVSRVREAQEQAERQKQPTASSEVASFKGALMSPDATDEVSDAFDRLRQNQSKAADNSVMEEQAEKLLRPMLKEWLDENLPTLVERLVREEIERVARG